MIEIQEFRKKVVAWLKGIPGVSDEVDERVYHSWPQAVPTYPLITFTVRKRRALDYNVHAWAGVLTINVRSTDDEVSDAVEDAILEDMMDGDVPAGNLSTAGKTRCVSFDYEETADDEPVFDLQDGSYAHTVRSLTFMFLLVALTEG